MLLWGALSDERTDLSFIIAAGTGHPKALGSTFFAFYDLQGDGGGI
jgi:hypothetical protein